MIIGDFSDCFLGASISPQYYPLLSVPVPQPINAVQMLADDIRVQGQDQHWNVTIFFAGQDKNVYKYSVGKRSSDNTKWSSINTYLL